MYVYIKPIGDYMNYSSFHINLKLITTSNFLKMFLGQVLTKPVYTWWSKYINPVMMIS